jgi:hypothetical protein
MTTANKNTGGEKPAGEDIGDDVMNEVASNLGGTLGTAETPEVDGNEGAAEETDEEKTAREAAEAGTAGAGEGGEVEETEEEKTAREAAEAEAAGAGEETAEKKATREAAEAESAASNPGKAEKDAAAAQLADKLKDATPEARAAAQAVIDGIIDGVVVKERAETTRLGARVTELAAELETAQKAKGPTIVGSVNPVFMADDEAPIDAREAEIEEFERWAARNANGSNLPDAKDYDETKPSYTAEQIEQRLTQVLHEKKKILPAARANLQERAKIEKNLRIIYPAIFDPKAPEYAQVQQVLKVLPELKQFADHRVIALKQILGDRALADLLAKRKKESSPKGKIEQPKGATPPKKTPPRAPGGGAPAKGGVLDPRGKQAAAPDAVKKVMSNPGDKTAFRAAVGSLLTDL